VAATLVPKVSAEAELKKRCPFDRLQRRQNARRNRVRRIVKPVKKSNPDGYSLRNSRRTLWSKLLAFSRIRGHDRSAMWTCRSELVFQIEEHAAPDSAR
jgi:hypothetical protein